MKRDDDLDAWIPLEDYIIGGVRHTRSREVHELDKNPAEIPERWVALEDHALHGMRMVREVANDEAYIDRLKPAPPPPDVPREAYWTIFDALHEVWSMPGSKSAVFMRLSVMTMADRADRASGRISETEFQRRQAAIEEIRLQYAARAEEVNNWFLENRFRLFETLPNA
ncbi:MAG: hypothetical protein HQM01_02730 [Magnetococcales bacterium]|nr:hypothetical protein [Magnetococcales bacterium]